MSLKKILNYLIFITFLIGIATCQSSFAATDIEIKQKETREQINRLKWLESVETNKLYKNQQKLETATNNLTTSKSKIASAQKELGNLQVKLDKASAEYNALNNILATHIRGVYKTWFSLWKCFCKRLSLLCTVLWGYIFR